MKNWNTDISKFKSAKDKRVWEISQLINYGLDGEKLDRKELEKYWAEIKKLVDPERARMVEYILWQKVYSLSPKERFFGLSPKINS